MVDKNPRMSLFHNSRFYVLASALALSLVVLAGLRLTIANDRLWYIRTEQVFGLLTLIYWYAALIISPLSKVIGQRAWLEVLKFARRGIGVSAAYFAALHVAISFWGQLGGFDSVALLPPAFKWSLGLGVVGFVVLLVMAATSLDRVVAWMTFRRWKWLHRTGYLAGFAVLIHVWIIGTHVANDVLALIAFEMLALLFGLEAVRVTRLLKAKKWRPRRAAMVGWVLWLVLCSSLLVIRSEIQSYGQVFEQHSQPTGGAHE